MATHESYLNDAGVGLSSSELPEHGQESQQIQGLICFPDTMLCWRTIIQLQHIHVRMVCDHLESSDNLSHHHLY